MGRPVNQTAFSPEKEMLNKLLNPPMLAPSPLSLPRMNSVEEPQQLSAMERRRLALEKIDNAKFSFYHVRYMLGS